MSSNVLSRLSKLGAVMPSRRRVLDPSEMEEEENYLPDVSDVAPIPINEPTPTAEGGIAPESFDVRANQIIEPKEAEPNLHENVGRALGKLARKEAEIEAPIVSENDRIEKQYENYAQEPLENPSIPVKEPTFREKINKSIGETISQPVNATLSKLGSGIKEFAIDRYKKSTLPQAIESFEDTFLGGQNAERREVEEKQKMLEEEKIQAQKIAESNPWSIVAYGSNDELANSPELQQEFTTITGQEYDEEMQNTLKLYEEALAPQYENLQNIIGDLSEDAKRIRNRIESGQATDMDKYYIGLSLALPLIIGGFFGAEAGLSSLGGAAKGLSESLANKEKLIRNDEELLADINRRRAEAQAQQGNLQLKSAELPQKIREDFLKNKPTHLMGLKAIPYRDPDTGEEKLAPQIENDLYVKPDLVNTDKKWEAKSKEAISLIKQKNEVDRLDKLTDDAAKILSQLKDSTIFKKLFINALTNRDSSGILSKITQDVMVDGRKENAGIALNTIFGQIANRYGQANELGQLDRAAQSHIKSLINNPESSFATPKDTLNQLLLIKKNSQNGILDDAKSLGYLPSKWEKEFGERNRNLYRGLNQKESMKESEKRKLEAVRNQ